MTPSIELRNMAAERHDALTRFEDLLLMAEDNGDSQDQSEWRYEVEWLYESFCQKHGFRLMTDASGLFLRCASSGIPLVVGDNTSELGDGELILVKQAA